MSKCPFNSKNVCKECKLFIPISNVKFDHLPLKDQTADKNIYICTFRAQYLNIYKADFINNLINKIKTKTKEQTISEISKITNSFQVFLDK